MNCVIMIIIIMRNTTGTQGDVFNGCKKEMTGNTPWREQGLAEANRERKTNQRT